MSPRRVISISFNKMLSMYLHDRAHSLTFRLIGGLFRVEAGEVEQAWKTASPTLKGREFIIDLTGVTALDAGGQESLRRLAEQGARFITASEFTELAAREASGRTPEALPVPRVGRWRRWVCFAVGCCRAAGWALSMSLPCVKRIQRLW
ncbi:MAG: hypothetical protein IPP47_15620 [Bryobacterales bacterium]|nr:hypothetical protein [Bryobacterales bacterium]